MLKYLKNVTTLQLDTEACNGCGMCANVCPHGVFEINSRKTTIVDLDACMECGACVNNCPVNAISVKTGVGCATGVLFGALGKQTECSGSCGVTPEKKETVPDCSCNVDNAAPKISNVKSCCSRK
jgi:NAD-dependent dihydropyrimidine dehydrogenase PreA subunit